MRKVLYCTDIGAYGCACCPPNIARLLASLGGYFYSTDANGVYVHLYATGTATIPMPTGGEITLAQRADYPWSGDIEITVAANSGGAKSLLLRVPFWADNATVTIDGHALGKEVIPGSYVEIPMPAAGGTIRLTLPMTVERVESHPHVLGNLGRVALRRGPLIYCIEQVDHPGTDVWDIALPDDAELTPEFVPDLLGGVTILRGQAVAQEVEADAPLYRSACQSRPTRAVTLTAIPYYAWANRAPGPMTVWIPRR